METTQLVSLFVSLILGGYLGVLYRKNVLEKRYDSLEKEGGKLIKDAEHDAKRILHDARRKATRIEDDSKREEVNKRKSLHQLEQKLVHKNDDFDKKIDEIDKKREEMNVKIQDIKNFKQQVQLLVDKQAEKLSSIAGYSKDEAKEHLMKQVEEQFKDEFVEHLKKVEIELKKDASVKAKNIVIDAIQKCVTETTAESTTTMVDLPSDDLKGRIIGREGRNINAFEHFTGIDVIVDDTPGSIMISGFDLVRRYIAKVSLERLLEDGRIHPGRIEETVAKVKDEVGDLIKELGEKAVLETGIIGLHPDLIKLVGRLKFYTTHGQNVLKHSIEVAFLASALASELQANVNVCLKAGLLHDIGRTVDHEVQGHHSIVGRDIAKKYGIQEDVYHCIEAHHNLVEPKSLEAKIVQVANLISNSRPGATRENLEQYVKRLSELESIAKSFDGVEKAYAVQAGKEVRIFIDPEKVNDLESVKLSYKIARKIENDLQYPGEIKVHIYREVKVSAVAK